MVLMTIWRRRAFVIRFERYPGTHHGFVFPQRGLWYHKRSAERHWEQILALLRRNGLQPGPATN